MTSKSLNNQKNGLVIADSGAIFSLAIIDQLEILNLLFDYIRIPLAVWKEITRASVGCRFGLQSLKKALKRVCALGLFFQQYLLNSVFFVV
ncbi:hypothetical protein BGP_3980 [Beggiatoa sp. PS]|nr:hypothetical protein BGP_3980 [Beggiatoa sp. PS]